MTTIRREPAPASTPVFRPYVWRGDPALSLANEAPRMIRHWVRRYDGKTVMELAKEWDVSQDAAYSRIKARGMTPDP